MRGVVFTGERELELMQFPDPTPDAHDVIIEMKASGMCGSDLHQYRRPKGHAQATGIPNAGGSRHRRARTLRRRGRGRHVGRCEGGTHRPAGDGAPLSGLHQCNHCRSGWQQLCQEVPVKVYGNNAHGGHAPVFEGSRQHVVPLPDELSFSAGAAIACGSGNRPTARCAA